MLTIGDRSINSEDFRNILFRGDLITVNEKAKKRVTDSFDFLQSFHQDKIIYGINTGLGPMAQYRVDETDRIKLQYNAIRSHAAGCGEPVSALYVRSSLIVLLNNFLQGHSGIHPEIIDLLTLMINLRIIPVVPEHGGVGASGDLVQLAHIALAMIGEGEVYYNGEIIPAARALGLNQLRPATFHIREGLSLINGTCFMTGTGIVNLIHAKNLLAWSLLRMLP